MIKYCKDCKAVFDEEDAKLEDCGFYTEVWGHQEYQVFDRFRCPDCNSDEIDDAEKCEECGDYFPPDELDENGLCPGCHEDYHEDDEEQDEQNPSNLSEKGKQLAAAVALQCWAEGRSALELFEDYVVEMEDAANKIKDFCKELNVSETTKFLFINRVTGFIDALVDGNKEVRNEIKVNQKGEENG